MVHMLCCTKRSSVLTGASDDTDSKKQRHDTASGTAYSPEDQELPSWITERVRPCHVLAHKGNTQAPPQAPSSATQQQAKKQQQKKGKGIQATPVLEQPQSTQPQHILYWMRTALRGHENPALDVAKHEAKQQGLPLLVAAFVLTAHPYPTARRFKFWMEGLRDTQRELRAQAGASKFTCASTCCIFAYLVHHINFWSVSIYSYE